MALRIIKDNKGQALMELLLGIGIAAILLGSTAGVTRIITRSNSDVKKVSTANSLAREMLDDLRVMADGSWKTLWELNRGQDHIYSLNTSATPFTVNVGEESLTINDITYTRSFYLMNVNRQEVDDSVVSSGGVLDPISLEVTVVVKWDGNSEGLVYNDLLVRYRNYILRQSSWGGGTDELEPKDTVGDTFATSTGVNYEEGEVIKLNGF